MPATTSGRTRRRRARTISEIDTAIGRLLDGLCRRVSFEQRVNVVDRLRPRHGDDAGQDSAIAIEDMVDPADARRVTIGRSGRLCAATGP